MTVLIDVFGMQIEMTGGIAFAFCLLVGGITLVASIVLTKLFHK